MILLIFARKSYRPNMLAKFMLISLFRRVSRFWCFRTPGAPITKILLHTGVLPCLVPSCLKLFRLVSRSDLVLDADHALDFYPISFYRRVSRFVVFQTKVAHLCFCHVRIKRRCSHLLFSWPSPQTHRDAVALRCCHVCGVSGRWPLKAHRLRHLSHSPSRLHIKHAHPSLRASLRFLVLGL